MSYIFILDYEHLDNGGFLKELSKLLSVSDIPNSIFLHSDSPYTDRIMQTGFMRDEAKVRATKELNHRLVALFADDGIAVTGLNAYQRNVVSKNSADGLSIDINYLQNLLRHSHVLLTNLIDGTNGTYEHVKLTELAIEIAKKSEISAIFAFSKNFKGSFISQNGNIQEEYPDSIEIIEDKISLISEKNVKTGSLVLPS